jgi:putative tricarboxylic transport membrane protein
VRPGPALFTADQGLVFPLFVGMFLANIVMLVIGLSTSKAVSGMVLIPYRYLMPVIAMFAFLGAFGATGLMYDMWIALVFGLLGYLLQRFDYPIAPVALAMVLGPIIENNMRRALIMSGGEWTTFVTRPISLGILLVAALLLAIGIWRHQRSGDVASVVEP